MIPIPFFSGDIEIDVHTATYEQHVGHAMSVDEFSGLEPVSLYRLDNGELLARLNDQTFIEGPEVIE